MDIILNICYSEDSPKVCFLVFFWSQRRCRKENSFFLFVLAGFNGKLQFLGIEVSEAEFFCMPANGSVPAGEKQAVFKQIIEAAVFFNIFSWEVGGDVMFANF